MVWKMRRTVCFLGSTFPETAMRILATSPKGRSSSWTSSKSDRIIKAFQRYTRVSTTKIEVFRQHRDYWRARTPKLSKPFFPRRAIVSEGSPSRCVIFFEDISLSSAKYLGETRCNWKKMRRRLTARSEAAFFRTSGAIVRFASGRGGVFSSETDSIVQIRTNRNRESRQENVRKVVECAKRWTGFQCVPCRYFVH